MRTALICHHDSPLSRDVLPRYLASFSDLSGVVVIAEQGDRRKQRLGREWKRSGPRLADVLAFRLYYRLFLAGRDREWVRQRVEQELERYPDPADVPVHETADPNSDDTRAFLERVRPDVVLARCKTLLRPEIFNIPATGTFVVHPGICPEYRNAHGCFWAMARGDMNRVGATLLRIDEGVDTGPIYAYYRTSIDERRETHQMIQQAMVFDNLDAIAGDLAKVHRGEGEAIDVSGRESAAWGQPRLSDYIRWKIGARRRARGRGR